MRYIHCPSSARLRCYEHSQATCPLKAHAWMEAVLRWALTNRTPRSLDTSAVLGGLNIGGSEAAAVRSANIHQLFRDPEAVLGWLLGSQEGRVGITADICADLKQAHHRWKEIRKAERFDRVREEALEPFIRH